MDISEEQINAFEKKNQERERKVRQRTWLLTIVPLVFAAILLGYTIWQIYAAEKQLADTKNTLITLTAQLAGAENELSIKRTQVPQAQATLKTVQENLSQLKMDMATAIIQAGQLQTNLATATAQIGQLDSELKKVQVFADNKCPIDEGVIKNRGYDIPQVDFLFELLGMQYDEVPWNPSGFSEKAGFDSPNFALYALQTRVGFSPTSPPGTLLWNILPQTPQLKNGDIVYDAAGYTMFYYRLPVSLTSPEMMECVIGMTPLRIQALKFNFTKWSGYLQGPFAVR